jgi:acetyltransferase-like isoleucine patch superfamily enzyme
MSDNTDIRAPVSWRASDQPLPRPSEELLCALSELGLILNDLNARKLTMALDLAGAEFGRFRLVDTHPKLPQCWTERNNKLFVPAELDTDTLPSIAFHSGVPAPENCTLFLGSTSNYSILLWGADSLLYISPQASIPSAHLAVGDGFAFIGPMVRSTARLNINCRNKGSVMLTKDILIGSDVKFQSDDCHTIIDMLSNTRINPFGGTIIVKNHVWLGEDALVLGDTFISENCIIGARTFLRGVMAPSNAIIAGVPARVTRSDVSWDSRDLPPNHPDLG